jgi:hypothetical protein
VELPAEEGVEVVEAGELAVDLADDQLGEEWGVQGLLDEETEQDEEKEHRIVVVAGMESVPGMGIAVVEAEDR